MSEQQPLTPGPPPPPAAIAPPGPHQPPAPPWYAYPPAPVLRPNHPRASAALTLGIVAVCGVIVGITLVLAPLAWYYGATAVREIDREPGRWGGRGTAKAGLVLGMVGSALLVLAMLTLAVIAGGVALVNGFDSGYPR